MQWRPATSDAGDISGVNEDQYSYATGWTISGLATLLTIVVIWVLGI
jgi:hypothetical protein